MTLMKKMNTINDFVHSLQQQYTHSSFHQHFSTHISLKFIKTLVIVQSFCDINVGMWCVMNEERNGFYWGDELVMICMIYMNGLCVCFVFHQQWELFEELFFNPFQNNKLSLFIISTFFSMFLILFIFMIVGMIVCVSSPFILFVRKKNIKI